jgi:hypothetical protein
LGEAGQRPLNYETLAGDNELQLKSILNGQNGWEDKREKR